MSSSCFAHTLIIIHITPASTTQSRPLFSCLIWIISREICISVPCHGAGSSLCTACKCSARWVAAASLNLAAFQTSVEEDEGSLARLSRRESKGLAQPTSVEGTRGRGEPPTLRLEIRWGRQTRYSKALAGAICFTIRRWLSSWKGTVWFLPMRIRQKCD